MAAVPVGNICDKNTFFNFLSLCLSLSLLFWGFACCRLALRFVPSLYPSETFCCFFQNCIVLIFWGFHQLLS